MTGIWISDGATIDFTEKIMGLNLAEKVDNFITNSLLINNLFFTSKVYDQSRIY